MSEAERLCKRGARGNAATRNSIPGASKRFIAEFINIIDPKRSSRQRLERKGPPGHHLHCGDLSDLAVYACNSILCDLQLVAYNLETSTNISVKVVLCNLKACSSLLFHSNGRTWKGIHPMLRQIMMVTVTAGALTGGPTADAPALGAGHDGPFGEFSAHRIGQSDALSQPATEYYGEDALTFMKKPQLGHFLDGCRAAPGRHPCVR
jgi:hypothetical protein